MQFHKIMVYLKNQQSTTGLTLYLKKLNLIFLPMRNVLYQRILFENILLKIIFHYHKTSERHTLREWKNRESESKGKANISIEIRQENKLSYLSMNDLANLVDKRDQTAI